MGIRGRAVAPRQDAGPREQRVLPRARGRLGHRVGAAWGGWSQLSHVSLQPGGSGKCQGRGSTSQCPPVRSHAPQGGGTGSVAAVRGVGMNIQPH